MFFNKVFFLGCILSLSLILAHPLMTKREDDTGVILARAAKPPAKPAAKPHPVKLFTGKDVVSEARKANSAPGREVPKKCKKANDCSCPKLPNPAKIQSTSCINGFCACNNPGVNFLGEQTMEAFKAVGNAPITKVMGHVFQGIADVKQVLSTVVGTVLGPVGKFATKIASFAIPDTGPSHIDQLTNGVLKKVF